MFVPPAMHQPCTAATVGLVESWSLAHVAANGPMTCWSAALSHTRSARSAVAGLGRGRPVEPVAGAERRALGVEQDHPDVAVALGVVERVAQLVAQLGRDRVVRVGAAQRQPPHRALVAHSDRVAGHPATQPHPTVTVNPGECPDHERRGDSRAARRAAPSCRSSRRSANRSTDRPTMSSPYRAP